MVLALFFAAFMLLSCAEMRDDNPYDKDSKNYIGNQPGNSSGSNSQGTGGQSSSGGGGNPGTSSDSGDNPVARGDSGTFTDLRDGTVYKWIDIGDQRWMAENLNYAIGGKCYNEGNEDQMIIDPGEYEGRRITTEEVQANCAKYGRLYDWATAMGFEENCNHTFCTETSKKHQGVCPQGWHIPNGTEWATLAAYVGGEGAYNAEGAGKVLKATDGWNWDNSNNSSGNGTDAYGFAALPGGFGYSDGSFSDVGNYGTWWSTSEGNATGAYYRSMIYYHGSADWSLNAKTLLFGVRCLKD